MEGCNVGPVSYCMEDGVRRNGFQCPVETSQVLSWVFYGYLLLSFSLVIAPSFPSTVAVVLTLLFLPLALLTFASAWAATATDTADSHLAKRLISRAAMSDQAVREARLAAPAGTEWCYNCRWYVSARSYHCRKCDKCSEDLDHHCGYFNNCIGAKNYRVFIIATASAWMMCAFHLSFDVGILIDDYSVSNSRDTMAEFYGVDDIPQWIFRAVLYIAAIMCILAVFLLGHLLCFHMFLWHTGLLTHQYILGEGSFGSSHMNRSGSLSGSSRSASKKGKLISCDCCFKSKATSPSAATSQLDLKDGHSSVELQTSTVPKASVGVQVDEDHSDPSHDEGSIFHVEPEPEHA